MKQFLLLLFVILYNPAFSQFDLKYYTKSKKLASASGNKSFNYFEVYDLDTGTFLEGYPRDVVIYLNFNHKYNDTSLNEGYLTGFNGNERLFKLPFNNGIYVPETSEWPEQWKFAVYRNDYIIYFLDTNEIMIKDSKERKKYFFSNKALK